MNSLRLVVLCVITCVVLACGDEGQGDGHGQGDGDSSETSDEESMIMLAIEGDEQTPPSTGEAEAVQVWLRAGHYLQWQCEAEPHAPRGMSAHGMNRTCSNDRVSAFSGSAGDERPIGSAAVKEFWNEDKVFGHALYVKTKAKSAGGDNWYWFVAIDGMGVLANGLGSEDPTAKMACVACHGPAGNDETHTTSDHSGDFVYTQVE